MKFKMIFTFDGTLFYGYAKQKDKRTVQDVIEKALFNIFQEDIKIYASGRTDKGVHALNQVCDFSVITNKDCKSIKQSLNKILPNDIYIKSIESVIDSFSSRFNAKYKIYEYRINTTEYNPLNRNYELFENRLYLDLIKDAKELFIGKKDFKNFTSKTTDKNNFIRTIYSISIKKTPNGFNLIFKGDGFMKYEVRKIVGVLLEIGKGKLTKDYIEEYLNKKERDIVSYTASPQALYLKEVIY